MKKTNVFLSLLVMAMLCLNVQFGFAQDREHILKVYNWADYIDEDLIGEFEEWYEEQTGEKVKIQYATFDINENMLQQIEMGHEDYDVVCPSDYIIERMLRKNLLQPINKDFGQTPNYLNNVSPYVVEQFEKMGHDSNLVVNDYTIGYMWGTGGFIYNAKYVSDDEVKSWSALQNPKFAQKIFMKDAVLDIYCMMACVTNYDDIKSGKVTRDELFGNITPERLAKIEEYLKNAKGQFCGWETDFGKEYMTQEKAWINLSWSGDAAWAIEEAEEVGVELRYVVPEEGSNVWFDGWVIPKYAVNTKAASYFINFMCKPENAIRNMDEIGYVSVIATPEILEYAIDSTFEETSNLAYFFGDSCNADAIHVNPVYYADQSVIDRCALEHEAGEMTEQLMEMFSHVKGDSLDSNMVVILLVVVVAIVVVIVAGVSKRKKEQERRKARKNA